MHDGIYEGLADQFPVEGTAAVPLFAADFSFPSSCPLSAVTLSMTLAGGVRFLLPLLLRDQLFRRSDNTRAIPSLQRLRTSA